MKYIRGAGGMFLAFILTLCFMYIPGYAAPRQYQGMDVSQWQGEIDFEAVRTSGVQVVYIRTGEGAEYVDAYFQSNYDKALAAGMKIGFYHYVTASTTAQAQQQAEFFYSLIRDKQTDCCPAMDFESFPGLTDEEINRIGAAFMETLADRLGYAPAIYTDSYNAASLWDSSFSAYPLWVADYGVTQPESTGPWTTWDGFQYTDRGQAPGVSGYVDMDYFKDSIFVTRPAPLPEPTPPPEPTPQPEPGPGGIEALITYKVQPGDTLWAISRRFDTTVSQLAALNHIADPDLIDAEEVLDLPQQPGSIIYRVKQGDTLSAIAERFGATVSSLVYINGIHNPNLIYVGQTLFIL